MATRTVVCPECGAEVPSGRLSCAACGTLIASVAGSPKRAVAADPVAATGPGDPAALDGDAVDAAAASARRARTAAAAEWKRGMDAAEEQAVPPILRDWTGPSPLGVVTEPASGGASGPAPAWTPPAWTSPPPAVPEPRGEEPTLLDDDESWDERPDAPADDAASLGLPPGSGSESGWRSRPPVPGAYVAPEIVPAAAATASAVGRPATASAIAAAAVVDGTLQSVPAQPRPDRWFSVPAAAPDGVAPGKAGLFSDLPFRTPGDAPSWAVALGSLFGAVAFVLPNWSSQGVMGTQGGTSFFANWGLANPADLVPMVTAIVVLFVTLIPNRIPTSIRRAVLPILVGGWFLGIFWTYATSSFGLGWGVDAIAIGGVILVLGGALGAARLDDVVVPKSKAGPDSA
jgi:hypothetical protein